MYAVEWSEKRHDKKKNETAMVESAYLGKVKKAAPIVWGEHCVECAMPACYGVCSHYRKREDGRCKLLENGLLKKKNKSALWGYCIQIGFEGWSKIEANCNVGQYSLGFIKFIDVMISSIAKGIVKVSRRLASKKKRWRLTTFVYKVREGIALVLGKRKKVPDAFLISVMNEEETINLILEVKSGNGEVRYRNSFKMSNGYNEFCIPYADLQIVTGHEKILLYPENTEKTRRFVFYALDFITLSDKEERGYEKGEGKKIKLVVWDLDNTLWSGVLVESNAVAVKKEVVQVIKELDQRGIINSIASKNDYEAAYEKLKEFGLDEYFVMPEINWNPKSVNIKKIVKDMNIGIDTVAFVDDTEFELNEVKTNAPEVLCINALDFERILEMSRFNVIVTDDTMNRRKTYKMLELQREEQKNWEGDIDGFLRSCEMRLTIGRPTLEELPRCYELLQRTNQLNSSGRRLSLEEVTELYHSNEYECFLLSCEDRFGKYGIIGFSIVELKEVPIITDFVISCRVANKKVEHTYLMFLAERYKKLSYEKMFMRYKKTVKNGPIFKVVKDLHMSEEKVDLEYEVFSVDLRIPLDDIGVMEVIER